MRSSAGYWLSEIGSGMGSNKRVAQWHLDQSEVGCVTLLNTGIMSLQTVCQGP